MMAIFVSPSAMASESQVDEPNASLTIKSNGYFWQINWKLSYSGTEIDYTGSEDMKVEFVAGRDRMGVTYAIYSGFYCIKRNGVEINLTPESPDDKYNYFDIEDGDVIEVVSPVPDKMCRVTFSSPEGAGDMVTKAYYTTIEPSYGTEIYHEVDNPVSFDAPAGTRIRWEWNEDAYRTPSTASVNGHTVKIASIKECFVPVDRDNVSISLNAEPWQPVDVQVDIDDASKVVVTDGSTSFDDRYQIHDGLQTLTIFENRRLTFFPTGESEITSIIAYGVEQLTAAESDNKYGAVYPGDVAWEKIVSGTATDGVIYVKTADRVRDIPFMVFADDCNGAAKVWSESYMQPYHFDITDGENSLKMCYMDLKNLMASLDSDESSPEGHIVSYPFYLWSTSSHNQFSLQGVRGKPDYFVMHIYPEGGYESHKVTFNTDFDESEYEILQDHVYAINPSYIEYMRHGTRMRINMLGETGADVIVNGKKLESASPMSHVFTVTEPASVEIKRVTTTGVEDVDADNTADAVYYNMQGVRVDNPGKGVYIEVRGGKASKVMF